MNWIGIDPGTKCGWALLDRAGGRIASGTWQLERRKGDGAGMLYIRFERLFRELLEPRCCVIYEQQANRFAGSSEIGAGIMTHIQSICEAASVPYSGITFSVVKKWATGKGNCGKQAMVDAAAERWFGGIASKVSEDEADALWVADAGRAGLA